MDSAIKRHCIVPAKKNGTIKYLEVYASASSHSLAALGGQVPGTAEPQPITIPTSYLSIYEARDVLSYSDIVHVDAQHG